jgi:hypothetical protein
VREVFEEGEPQRLAVGRRQRVDGVADDHPAVRAPDLLGRAVTSIGRAPEPEAL